MAILADFMLVYLPYPTISLRPPLAINAGPIAKIFAIICCYYKLHPSI